MEKKSPKKIFYFDVETTGINWWENDITQLGFIIEIDGEIKVEKDLLAKPVNWKTISPEALKVTGKTIEDLEKHPPAEEMYKELVDTMAQYVDKFDKNDKFYPAGYNVQFDLYFLEEFFRRNNDKYLGSLINWKRLDPLPILYMMDFNGSMRLPNYKLETVCNHFGIEIKAHDAFSDIRATRDLLHKLQNLSKENKENIKKLNETIKMLKEKKNKTKSDTTQLELM